MTSRTKSAALPAAATFLVAVMAVVAAASPLAEANGTVPAIETAGTNTAAGRPHPTPSPQATQQEMPSRDQRPVFGAEVSMVMVNVSVLDQDGLPVAGLTADDFIIYEDGAPQAVSVVLNPNEVPADIVVLMDISGSVRADQIAMKRDAMTLLDALKPDDCVCFITFGNEISEGVWGRPNDTELREAILTASISGYTPLYDAMLVGIGRLEQAADPCGQAEDPDEGQGVAGAPAAEAHAGEKPPEGAAHTEEPPEERRKALVVITDGGDTASQAEFSAAINVVSLTEVPIFPVAVGIALTESQEASIGAGGTRQRRPDPGADARVKNLEATGRDPVKEKENVFDHTHRVAHQSAQQRWDSRLRMWGLGFADSLKEIANISGGKYINGGESAASLRLAYLELLNWLRSSYVLGYYPPPHDLILTRRGRAIWHDLEVRARDESFRVYARPGYYRTDIDSVASAASVQVGVELLRENAAMDSLIAFNRALQQDPFNWQAFFYRGRAYGVLGRIEEAAADFLAAAQVGPGIGPVHQFVSISSEELGDFTTAWEHAIRAHQAGVDMLERFQVLRQTSPPVMHPPDLAERLEAPRLYVGPAVVPDPEAQAVIDATLRAIRLAISDSPEFGLITHAQLADYYLRLQVSSVETEGRGRVKGSLELHATAGGRLYDDGFTIQDVFEDVTTGRVLSGKLRDLAGWLDRRR